IAADLGGRPLDAFLVGPLPVLDASLDVDLLPLDEVLLQALGALAPEADAVPLGALLLLPALVVPHFGRRETEGGDRRAARGVAKLRVTSEVADENDLVHAAHMRLPFFDARSRVGL